MFSLNNLNTNFNYREKTSLLWTSFLYNLDKQDFLFFKLLLNEIYNYNLGLFKIEDKEELSDNEEKFFEIENKFYYYLIKYGEIFITNFNNEFQLWNINEKISDGINLKRVKAQLIQENQQVNYYQNSKIIEFWNLKQGIYVKWEEDILPAFLKYYNYIKYQIDFFKAWKTAAMLDNKKFIYNINNNSEEIAKREIESMLDPEKTFILNISPFTENNFEPMNLFKEVEKGESASKITYDNLINLRTYFKDIFGIALPRNDKKERKNLTESITENYATENIESIILKNLNTFAKQAKKLWNLNISFEKNREIIKNQTEEAKEDNVNTIAHNFSTK